jgi:uncharacterized phiE125 gp8 family phage protein
MSGLTVVTKPQDEPLGLTEVKEFLRLDEQVDDNFVRAFIIAAREWCENYTGRSFINRTLKLSLDGVSEADTPLWEGFKTGYDRTYYKNFIELPSSPVSSVTSIKYFDDSDTESTWDSSNYYVDTARDIPRIILRDGATFPSDLRKANGIEITYVAGYGAKPSNTPEALRVAMLQYIMNLYEHRGDDEGRQLAFPPLIRSLVQPYRITRFGDHVFSKGYATGGIAL